MGNTIKSEEHACFESEVCRARIRKSFPILRWIFTALLCGSLFIISPSAEAFLFHATRRAAVRRIMTRGLNPARFKGKTRFGKGLYLSRRISTALAEKGKKSAVIRMKPSRYLKRNTLDLRNPTKKKLRSLFGRKINLRGKLKKWIIGPKLGRRLSRIAGRKGKAIQYRSVKTGGANLMIPKKLVKKRPQIVRPEKIVR